MSVSSHQPGRARRLLLPSLSLLLLLPAQSPAHDLGPRFASGILAHTPTRPWTHQGFYANPDHFQIAIVSDRTGGARPGIFARAVDQLNLLKPEFVICVGDLIEGYTDDETEIETQWAEFDSLVERLDMPFFYVPGNHDISNPTMAARWQDRRGPPYYHFRYKDVLFLVLNTEDPPPTSISDEQVAYFGEALSSEPEPRHILVFMHKPLWLHDEPSGFTQIEALLRGRPHTVFAGHDHAYGRYLREGNRYYRLATTGGGSSLNGPGSGQFDHLVWLTMADEGPLLANLMMDGIYDDDPDAISPPPPDRAVAVRAPCATLTVDGDPEDWTSLESDSLRIALSDSQLGCALQFAWDDSCLYVLVREIGGDTTDGEAHDVAAFLEQVWKYESIALFLDLDNSNPFGISGTDFEPWLGFSSSGSSDLYCARSHRTGGGLCSQDYMGRGSVATSGSLEHNSRVIEVALAWADLDAAVDANRLPGGFLSVLKPGLRIGCAPLLLDDGHVGQTFIGGSRKKKPSGQDSNSRDILLTE